MDINTLITDIAKAVANDTAVDAWANATYGRRHLVFVNFDVRELPGEGSCPFVAVYPGDKLAGPVPEKKHRVEVTCCIHDEATKTYPETNIIEYEGVQRIEAFRKLVETAVLSVGIGNALFETVDIDYDTIDIFPYMLTAMVFTIKEPVLIGSDPYD